MKIIWNLSRAELQRLIRSTKMIVLALFTIFIDVQIITPLRGLSIDMGGRLSMFEPFAALGNSGVVLLILPLFFMVMMADFPREGESQYFCQIRCSKRVWAAGQIAYAVESAVMMTVFVFAASVLLSLDFISFHPDYSYAVTRYAAVFQDDAQSYVLELIPENLYHHFPLLLAVLQTALLLILYFIMLALLLLVFSLAKKKIAGILLDGILILLGTITCAGRMAYMWVFPMAHTIPWLHYQGYESEPVLPIGFSYLYFCVVNIVLVILSLVMSKRYNGI